MNSPSSTAAPDAQPKKESAIEQSSVSRLSLVLYPDAILRTVCQPVTRFDSALRDVAEEMLVLMRQHQGIGLAAPQVGLRERLIVCDIGGSPYVLANLDVRNSAEKQDCVEGCLSLPEVHVIVRRPEWIRVVGYDVHGQWRSFGATGLWARVIQHELDHLNGVLICDRQQPAAEQCPACPLGLPTEVIEERKRQSRV